MPRELRATGRQAVVRAAIGGASRAVEALDALRTILEEEFGHRLSRAELGIGEEVHDKIDEAITKVHEARRAIGRLR